MKYSAASVISPLEPWAAELLLAEGGEGPGPGLLVQLHPLPRQYPTKLPPHHPDGHVVVARVHAGKAGVVRVQHEEGLHLQVHALQINGRGGQPAVDGHLGPVLVQSRISNDQLLHGVGGKVVGGSYAAQVGAVAAAHQGSRHVRVVCHLYPVSVELTRNKNKITLKFLKNWIVHLGFF